jgi:hypothetical protein
MCILALQYKIKHHISSVYNVAHVANLLLTQFPQLKSDVLAATADTIIFQINSYLCK